MTSGAHLGGSRVYGEDSDVDLCVLVSHEEAKILGSCADALRPGCGSFPVRYGNLNIIVCTDPRTYRNWKRGCDNLKSMAPVTKEQARTMFRQMGVSKL